MSIQGLLNRLKRKKEQDELRAEHDILESLSQLYDAVSRRMPRGVDLSEEAMNQSEAVKEVRKLSKIERMARKLQERDARIWEDILHALNITFSHQLEKNGLEAQELTLDEKYERLTEFMADHPEKKPIYYNLLVNLKKLVDEP